MVLDKMAKCSLDFRFTSEDLPLHENRITLDPKENIILKYTENNMQGHKLLFAKFKSMLTEIGCKENHIIPHSLYG